METWSPPTRGCAPEENLEAGKRTCGAKPGSGVLHGARSVKLGRSY